MEMFFCRFPCFQSYNSTLCRKNKQKLKVEQLKAVERQLAKQERWTSSKQLWDESIDSKLRSSGKNLQDDPTKLDHVFLWIQKVLWLLSGWCWHVQHRQEEAIAKEMAYQCQDRLDGCETKWHDGVQHFELCFASCTKEIVLF